MKTYYRYLAQYAVIVDEITGQTVQTLTSPSATYDHFVVTGFGRGPGLIFVDPVAGTYSKTYWTTMTGRTDTKSTNRYSGVTWYHRSRTGYHDYGDSAGSYPVAYSPTVYNNALSDFWDGVKKSEQNLALLIGEARESGRMLQVGKSIYEVLQGARRARRLALHNPSLTFSQLWLSWKYGWQPLLTDVYGYLNWLYFVFDDGVPVRGRAVQYEGVNKTVYQGSYPQRYERHRGKRVWKAEVKCWVGLADTTHYNATRITSLNPVSIAWELLPLSFVCDWFFDVSSYLQNMESALASGVTFKRGYVTDLYTHKINFSNSFDAESIQGNDVITMEGYIENVYERAIKQRTVLSGFPFPRAPRIEAKLGWQRILSLTALLRTVILGGIEDDGRKPKRLPRRKPGRVPYRWNDYHS